MRVLVTGAAGFIGSHLSEELAALGHDVLGVDVLTDFYSVALKARNVSQLAERGVPVLPLDLAEDDFGEVVRGAEVVYHLAAQPGLSATSFAAYERNNVIATYRLLEALHGSRSLQAFIHVSSSSVYGSDASGAEDAEPKPTSYYGVTKLAAEQLVLARYRDANFPACAFRLFSVYGPRERPDKLFPKLIHSILDGTAFPLFEGSELHLRSYTFVSDIVDGLIAALDRLHVCTGEIFNLGTDTALTTGEGIRIVEEIMGRRANIVYQPPRPGDQAKTHANIAKIHSALGYVPRTTPRDGTRADGAVVSAVLCGWLGHAVK